MLSTHVSRLARGKGGLVTVGTVAALLLGIGATVFGLGVTDNAIANFDASSWLWSNNKGEVARVNGVTGRVDTRQKVTDSLGHTVNVSQNDRYAILRDLVTGKVSVLDLASLQFAANTQTTAGIGVTIALHDDTAFIIDTVQGVVSQLNPATLAPVGAPLRFMPGLAGGTFDADGRLWLLIPGEGSVVAIEPTANPAAKPHKNGGTGGSAAGDPKVVKTVPVAEPSHDLAISVLDKGVAVLDKTAGVLTTLRGDQTKTTTLSLTGPGAMPTRTNGADVPVTVVEGRDVYVVNGDKVAQFSVPGDGPKLKPCVAWSKRLYCADEATGNVYVLDAAGKLVTTVTVPDSAGNPLDLEVREDHLFINAPLSSKAEVVDNQGRVKLVDKYANNVLGGDPPPPVPPPPPQKPPVGPPGAPVNVRAAAGNASAHITWGAAPANNVPIMKYVVEGDGKPHEVGANQRSLDVTGLTNGQSYTFTVYAVNAKGNGPKRAANPVVPTSDVPDAPVSVTATDNKDGTVTVIWPPANGQGHPIASYQVTSIPAGPKDQVFAATSNTLTIPAGALTYGTQYAFTVAAINDKGANSKASPVSNTIVPYTVPDAPANPRAITVANQRGAIQVTWQRAKENGRPITKYVVDVGGKTQDVTNGTTATVSGLPDDKNVPVSIVAVNAAGESKPATTTGKTLAKPVVNGVNASSDFTSVTVVFSVDGGGTTPACVLSITGAGQDNGNCNRLQVASLEPGKTFTYSVTATNAAGADTKTGSIATKPLFGNVRCVANNEWINCDHGVGVYINSRQQTGEAKGDAYNGDPYRVFCKKEGTKGDQQDNATLKAANANNYKISNMWVQIDFKGARRYIPFIWINLENGDNVNALPDCK
jgi:Fibronectin type III domain